MHVHVCSIHVRSISLRRSRIRHFMYAYLCVYIYITCPPSKFFSLVNVKLSEEAQCHVDYPGPSSSGNFLPGSDSSESLSPSPQRDDLVPLSGVDSTVYVSC